jgi:hypothetical protein
MTHHTCKDLGVCKCPGRDCLDNTARPLRFAPGVLEGYREHVLGNAAQRRELRRWLMPALAFTAVVGLAGLAAGVIAGWLQ